MGGMIASTMASMRPERIDKLILSSTSLNHPNLAAIPDTLYVKWTNARTPEDLWESFEIAFGNTTLKPLPRWQKNILNIESRGQMDNLPKNL
jgi:pimeloyl-ACP methyl ester carboxylesterase